MLIETTEGAQAEPRPARKPRVMAARRSGMPPLREYMSEVVDRRQFIWHMARTNLKGKHFDSVLGQLWLILDPILLAAVYYMLRSVVRPMGSDPAARTALITHLIWAVSFFYFTRGVALGGAKSVLGNKRLVLNASFPRLILPLTALVTAVIEFIPTLGIYLLFHAFMGQPITMNLVFLLPILILQVTFNFGFGLLLAPAMVNYRDINGFITYFLRVWLYASPVLYTVAEIPAGLETYLRWNPLYPLYASLEQVFGGSPPSVDYLLAALAWAVTSLVIGMIVFMRKEGGLAIRL